uniref:Uncharacterized protein n=1 Tax=Arundo donax TaxID=35708 RepID=A0A0A9BD08_ARUDO
MAFLLHMIAFTLLLSCKLFQVSLVLGDNR